MPPTTTGQVGEFQVTGSNPAAKFSLKIHRGEGMSLLAMDWTDTPRPPDDFVGFAIEYREPGGDRFFALRNRLTFLGADPNDPLTASDPDIKSTLRSPIQKFRWVHFPRNADLPGLFEYRVTPVFMNASDVLSLGEPQTASIELARETFPFELNVAFTRGYVSSQAFVDRFGGNDAIKQLLPKAADEGLTFVPNPHHPKEAEAYAWMGFEARDAVNRLLDDAITDTGDVLVVAYDLNLPEVVNKLAQLGNRLKIIIDDGDDKHEKATSAETQAASILTAAGAQVKRQSMDGLQHNKFIVVTGLTNTVLCGSTNFSWRGFFIQANNAVTMRGDAAVALFSEAFDHYWNGTAAAFRSTASADWQAVALVNVTPDVTFSPHSDGSSGNAKMPEIVTAIRGTQSSLFYSLAFLYLSGSSSTPVPEAVDLVAAIDSVVSDPTKFVYGMSDHTVAGLDVRKPDGNLAIVSPGALQENVPEPFKSEPVGGSGTRLHHKFVVIDFDTDNPTVYLGSHNFGKNADTKNGENLVRIKDRRIATSYMIEALRLFDHYHFRAIVEELNNAGTPLTSLRLKKPPDRTAGEVAWFDEDYDDPQKVRDRTLFA